MGSLADPRDAFGLAHFLEHMLFVRTKSYPEPDGFKHFLRQHCDVVTKKPIEASAGEVRDNPRARSAKLRCGIARAASEEVAS